ncbi:MAG: phosphoribulokinase [Halothiobacillus sp. 14-56-357]|jgi:phosphoribulokinase|uniref:phosphoribulokinase n=1 Tax=Halothiobacillus sp. 15-55-196 TaxID=1970382 RepID=UPI000BC8EB56|nr:phosphoribulokinase [Halothiobacillus sp. 15-55-196]OZB35149.1 MAG: phosphoribulokinase [Halothiobacillus sp. 15-55-196]OZB55572.1 MAG: phosphoribulokinase [Halothiobacillus sp. 14-56-357]OZB77458.1 MAG: phosphoribulokinase [Halothiobacillus sp. 13-55-115]
MSVKHPVVAVTGSSGAGTTTVKRAFEHVFRRESLSPVVIEGDSFHSLSRVDFREAVKKAEALGNFSFSHFGPEANHFDKLAELFKTYGETGTGKKRYYIHSDQEAAEHNARLNTNLKPGEFTPWEDIPAGSDLLFYEGLHGLVKTDSIDASAHVDLGVGVVPIINLEWIQKIFRDNAERGYSAEATVDTILRRMPDYINHITPQFSRTDINFQRVPTVDTSNPFITRDIPTPDESLVIIRFSNPEKIGADFPYLLSMIPNSFMSRYNTIVVPGGKMSYAMDLILTPVIHNMIEQRNA